MDRADEVAIHTVAHANPTALYHAHLLAATRHVALPELLAKTSVTGSKPPVFGWMLRELGTNLFDPHHGGLAQAHHALAQDCPAGPPAWESEETRPGVHYKRCAGGRGRWSLHGWRCSACSERAPACGRRAAALPTLQTQWQALAGWHDPGLDALYTSMHLRTLLDTLAILRSSPPQEVADALSPQWHAYLAREGTELEDGFRYLGELLRCVREAVAAAGRAGE